MKLSEEEKNKRLQALKELLSEDDSPITKKDDEEDEYEEEENPEEEPTKEKSEGKKLKKENCGKKKSEEDDEDEKMKEDDDEEDDEDEKMKKDDDDEEEDDEDEKMKKESYQEHLVAMFDGTNLSEETKEKIKILFEAAVNYEVNKRVAKIKDSLDEEFKKAVEDKEASLQEEVDTYLSYVVNEWVSKNEVALKQQVKLDIMENFIGGLRQLFLEHNFNIPEEQTNMVDELMEKVDSLQKDIKTLAKKNIEISEQLNATKRKLIFKEITEGMTEFDVEKLKELVESKEFETTEDFKKGVSLIKEAYFKKDLGVSEKKEEVVSEQKEEIPANIHVYASMISKSVKK